jgi:uncharacterized membrane protein YczE
MLVKVLELLAEHGGLVSLIIGIPFVAMASAIVVLWKQNTKNQERLMRLIEQKVEADTKLELAFLSLKEVIQAQGRH